MAKTSVLPKPYGGELFREVVMGTAHAQWGGGGGGDTLIGALSCTVLYAVADPGGGAEGAYAPTNKPTQNMNLIIVEQIAMRACATKA